MEQLHTTLETLHAHQRDAHITFVEETHTYTVQCYTDKTFTSVTTWINSHFEQFDADAVISKMMNGRNWKAGHKYWGMLPEQIKAQWTESGNSVSKAGTELHYRIECFYNNPKITACAKQTNDVFYTMYMDAHAQTLAQESFEWQYFIDFVKDHPHLKPYRTEWRIFDTSILMAGSIDMVFEHEDGTLSIYDWKRSKAIENFNSFNKFSTTPSLCYLPDSNYWHYALQLNAYKVILENNYDKKVKDLCLVRLHPNASSYEVIKLPDLSEEVRELFRQKETDLLCKHMQTVVASI